MGLKSLFEERQVCGVDLSAARPVRVVAFRDKSAVVFKSAPELPSNCDIACALPARTSIVRRLESPFSSLGKTRRILPSLIDVQMPFSVEECSLAFSQISKGSGGNIEAVAAAARKTDVQDYVRHAESSGFDPVYLDVEGLALWHASIEELPPNGDERRAVIKIEGSGITLSLGEGSRLLAVHGLTSFETGHLRRLLTAAFRTPAPIKWCVAGALADDLSTEEALRQAGKEWFQEFVTHDSPHEFLARSLARRAITGETNGVNLRQGDLVHGLGAAAAGAKRRALATVMGICGVAMIGLALAANMAISGKVASLDDEFHSRAASLAGGSLSGASGIHALRLAEQQVEKKLLAAGPVLAPFKPSLLADLRRIAAAARDTELLLEDVTVSSTGMRIVGSAAAWSVPNELADGLRSEGMVVDLKREESLADESVRFVMAAEGRR